MEFRDPVYGRQELEKDVLRELIKSDPVQRLKSVHQSGPQPFFMSKKPLTRFPHSLGVMFLLKRFDASVEEQIAGLLHDVPHTAFSHVADFVFDTDDHEYHDSFLEDVVMNSEIPEILENHGFEVGYILDESNFRLLERDAPDLCADRIDYFLRDKKMLAGEDVQNLVEGLEIVDNRFVISGSDTAEDYALRYIEVDEDWYADPREVALTEVFAQVLRRGLEINLIEEEDLFGTDEEVIGILKSSDDPVIREQLETLDGDFRVEIDEEDYDIEVTTKARYVDPQVAKRDMKRISEISEKVRKRIEEHEKDVKSGYRLKIPD